MILKCLKNFFCRRQLRQDVSNKFTSRKMLEYPDNFSMEGCVIKDMNESLKI